MDGCHVCHLTNLTFQVSDFMKFLFFRYLLKNSRSKSTTMNKGAPKTTVTKATHPLLPPNLKTNGKYEVLSAPVKGESDKKEYKVIRLANGLTACLISDKAPIVDISDNESDEEMESEDDEDESDNERLSEDSGEKGRSEPDQKMAAAALTVSVGSFSDPKEVPGMAHFLEHMVFMGSKKFPQENDFDSFLSKRGGSDNASTDCQTTTFYFDCLEKHLYTALDKFAQFFISPLMKKGSIDREREAIDSEFQMALPSDSARKQQLLAHFSKDDSPVSTFTWGNLITLKENVSDDVLYGGVHEFRKRHYSANRMTLAIQARLPLEVLEAFVLDCFTKVPCNNLPQDDFTKFVDVYNTPSFAKLYYVEPSHNVTQMELTFALPSLLHKYKSKPHQYVSCLLGDEGVGSLLSYLRRKVWVLGITSGNSETGFDHNSMYAIFTLTMTLTEDGLTHIFEIIEAVFSYINMLKKIGPQERFYKELQVITDASFRFSIEIPAAEMVEDLSENMQFYPPEDYLTGSELCLKYDPEGIREVMDCLDPKKMNIMVLSTKTLPGVAYDKVEKWFGTKYMEREIPKDWLKKWENAVPLAEFAIPKPNPFLTTNYGLLPKNPNNPNYPEKVISSKLFELWYRKDDKFELPLARFHLYLITPLTQCDVKSKAMMDLYVHLLQMQLAEDAYPAVEAGFSYSIELKEKGIQVKIWGFNEKLPIFLELITKHIAEFSTNLKENMFDGVKESQKRIYCNQILKPTITAKEVRMNILVKNYSTVVEKYNILSTVTFEDIKNFGKLVIGKLFVKALIQGNVDQPTAINVINTFVSSLQCAALSPATYPKIQVRELPTGSSICNIESFNVNDSNTIVTFYYQSGPFSVKESVILQMLMLIIEEPLFNTLRTKEQLGYNISCCNRDTYGILGFTITVNSQATKFSTLHVYSRMQAFIKDVTGLLIMTNKEFEEIKRDLIKSKQCIDVHLEEEVTRNWSEIIEDDYLFDRLEQEIKAIESLKLADVKKWWQDNVSKNNFKKMSIQVNGFNVGADPESKTKGNELPAGSLKFTYLKDALSAGKIPPDTTFVSDIEAFKKTLKSFPVIGQIENN